MRGVEVFLDFLDLAFADFEQEVVFVLIDLAIFHFGM